MVSVLVGAAILVFSLLAVASGDTETSGGYKVTFGGSITPRNLPRGKSVPISLHVGGTVVPVGESRPPKLLRVKVAINRHGVIDTRGLPTCPSRKLQGRTTEQALEVCGDALVGTGHFTAHVDIPDQSPFPSVGELLTFNTRVNGRPALVGQVFGTQPVPVSRVLPFKIQRQGEGQFGAALLVTMPVVGSDWGYVTGFDMTFNRRFQYRGQPHSFLTASCPAPRGIREVPFKAAKGTFYLAEGESRVRVLSGSCQVR